jgi:hypothetical protein
MKSVKHIPDNGQLQHNIRITASFSYYGKAMPQMQRLYCPVAEWDDYNKW